MTPTLRDLLAAPERVTALPVEAIPSMLGELEGLRAVLLARLIAGQGQAQLPGPRLDKPGQPDRLLTPTEAAGMLGVTVRWLYQHQRTLPFTRKLSRRALRFSEVGLRRWLADRPAG